jgi:dCMP deaminase
MRIKRLSKIEVFMKVAYNISELSTCARRAVGCVIINKNGYISSTGFNGVSSGVQHCIDIPCGGHTSKSGTNLSSCQAIHAEANALMQCKDINSIESVFVTCSPCLHCIKLLANTSCKIIYYDFEYPGFDTTRIYWEGTKKGRRLIKCNS